MLNMKKFLLCSILLRSRDFSAAKQIPPVFR